MANVFRLFVRLFVLNSSRSVLTTTCSVTSPKKGRDAYFIREAFKKLSNSKIAVYQEAWYSASEKWEHGHSRASSSYTSLLNEPIKEGSDWDNNREDDSAIELLDGDESAQLWWNLKRNPDELEEVPTELPIEPDSSEFCFKSGRLMMLIGEMLYLLRPVVCVLALRKYYGFHKIRYQNCSVGVERVHGHHG